MEFDADATSTKFTVPVTDDTTDEEDETFTVTLSNVSSNAQLAADPTAEGTIVDDDDSTLVSNLDKANSSVYAVGGGDRAALGFSVPDASPDQDYVLTAVTVSIATGGNNFTTAIHGASGTRLGDRIYTLNGPTSPGAGEQTYTAPDGAILENGKTYFLVMAGGSTLTAVNRTANSGQSGVSGWKISNTGLYTTVGDSFGSQRFIAC